jgi:phosphoglucosamine mutase
MKNDYFLGGEQSGHILVFDGKHTTGDGIYTSLLMASLIIRSAKKDYLIQAGNELIKFPQVIASGTVSDKPDLDKMQELTDLKNSIQKDLGPEGIINVRYSGTEPVIRVMLESDNRSSVDQLAVSASKLCQAVQSHTGDDGKNIEIKDLSTGKRISTNV